MAHLLGLYRVPQVSYFSTTSILSDRSQFLSFFRTVPSDSFQFIGLAQLLQHFGWTWVGLLATDNDYGQEAMRTLKQEIGKMGFCVAFSETLLTSRSDRDAFYIVQVIRRSTANAIVVFLTEVDMVILLEEMVRQKITGKTWIASEAWSTSALLSNPKYSGVLFGTTGLSIQRGDIPELKEFLNSINPAKDADDIFVEEFWEENFGCKWANQKDYLGSTENRTKVCTGSEKMAETQSMYNDVTNLHITCGVYNTVYAIAMAFQAILSCTKGQGPFLNGACADILDFQPWQLLHYIKQTHFKTPIGTELSFDRYGNPLARYDVVNWQLGPEGTIRHVTVGTYDANAPPMKNLVLNESAIFWAASNSAQILQSVSDVHGTSGLMPGKINAIKEQKSSLGLKKHWEPSWL
ncbi:hypothetical protein NDU88_000611 [Pleurodeles waltl]|uniref:Receptor ligand binding region domain-containing protein n=1 Tax=Pleurodeles waltl TaxID=8319 RepID=A0AAV7KTW4_PLEWA|nr:hypothetical protein NDU88_000611 [Pleurodeles waltl]